MIPFLALIWIIAVPAVRSLGNESSYRSPLHICLSPDGRRAYVVNHTSNSIAILDVRARKLIDEIRVGPRPAHAAVSPDGRTLYVTDYYGDRVEFLDLQRRRVARVVETGYEPYGIAVSSDGARLYVANSLSDTVSIIDAGAGKALSAIPVGRSPRYLELTPDGSRLIVSNGLSHNLSIIELATGKVAQTRGLDATRSTAAVLRQIACLPNAPWAVVAHLVSRDKQIPTQIERGWIHSNGFSIVPLRPDGRHVTLLLDRLFDGAANPWGVAVSSDGARLYVSLSGVHEIALVDLPKALELAQAAGPQQTDRLAEDVEIAKKRGIARRVSSGGLGPRGMALSEATGELLVANYFSDDVSILDARTGVLRAVIRVGPRIPMNLRREGELAFNDARLTFQRWFSCASCHQEDATMDGLNWDLTNDGVGNPKNVKSLHDIHDTPPAMWSAVREDMQACVAAGQRFEGFLPDPKNHSALMEFIGHPERPPNPYREKRYQTAIQRGWKVFLSARCDSCHPPPLYTDRKSHDLGLATPSDPYSRFDTPSLRECYRTAPYLHDGRAPVLREIFTRYDPNGVHGQTKGLSNGELDDLAAYLRSL